MAQIVGAMCLKALEVKCTEMSEIQSRSAKMGFTGAFGLGGEVAVDVPGKGATTFRTCTFSFIGEISAEEMKTLQDYLAGTMQDWTMGKCVMFKHGL
jgi:hypothetical protein